MMLFAGLANGRVAGSRGSAAQQIGFLASCLVGCLVDYSDIENPTVGNACFLWQRWERELKLMGDAACESELVRIAKGFSARLSGFVVSGGLFHLKQMVESEGQKAAMDKIMKDLPEPLPKELASSLASFRVAASWTADSMSTDGLKEAAPSALQQCLPFLTRYYGIDHVFLKAMLPDAMEKATLYVKAVEEALSQWVQTCSIDLEDISETLDRLRPGLEVSGDSLR